MCLRSHLLLLLLLLLLLRRLSRLLSRRRSLLLLRLLLRPMRPSGDDFSARPANKYALGVKLRLQTQCSAVNRETSADRVNSHFRARNCVDSWYERAGRGTRGPALPTKRLSIISGSPSDKLDACRDIVMRQPTL